MFRWLMGICLLLIAAVVASLSAGDRDAHRDESADFRYVNSTDINTLDPARMSWTPDIRVAINIWEGLTTYHPQTTQPCEGVAYFPPEVSDDGLVYTFTLRPDARWSNGDLVTAADFVRGWRRAIEPGTAADYAVFLTTFVRGADEYYHWRNSWASVSTALHRLSAGWAVDAAAAKALAESDVLNGQVPRAATAAQISALRLDWAGLHGASLRRHAGEMDARFAHVGIEGLDAHTLRVTLRQRCPYFLDLCAFATLLPCHRSIEYLREQVADTGLTPQGLVVYDPQWTKPDYQANGYPGLVTNGPYRLVEWTFKRRVRLEANPFYWARAAVGCPRIDMLVYGDLNSAIMAYERGDVDFLPEMGVDYDHRLVELARTGKRPDFHFPAVFGTYFYSFNCRDVTVGGRPNPFVDARVRKAFALAVDRQAISEQVVGRGDPVSLHLVPAGTIVGYTPPQAAGYDPDAARRLLAEAGYPEGRGLPVIDLLYNTGGQHGRICEAMAKMWTRHLGAAFELRGKEAKTFAEDKVRGHYMIARAGWYGDYADPTTFLDIFATDNGNNDAGFSKPAYDGLLERASRATDAGERMHLLAEAEALLVNDAFPLLPLYQYTNLMAIKPHVQGLYPNPRLTFPFRYIRIER